MVAWWLCLLLVVGCLGQEEDEDPFDGKYVLARKAFGEGDLVTAQALLEELLPEHGEQFSSVYADLAVAYMYNNRVNEAHRTYVAGLEIHGGDGMLHRGYCQFGARVYKTESMPEGMDYEDVIASCIDGINSRQSDFFTYSLISKLLYKEGAYNEALTFLENGLKYAQKAYYQYKSAKRKPKFGQRADEEKEEMNKQIYFDMLHSLAVIHMDHGNPERALEICDTLLGLDYERFSVLVGQVRARLVPYDKLAADLLASHLATKAASCETSIGCDSGLNVVFDWEKLPQASDVKVQQINKETALLPFGPAFSRGETEGRYSNFKIYHTEMNDVYLSGNALRKECELIAGSQKQSLGSNNICLETSPDIEEISSDVPLFSLFPNFGSESYLHWVLGGITRVVRYQSMFSDVFSKGEYQLLLSRREEGEMKGFVRESLELLLGDIEGKVVEYPSSRATHVTSTLHVIDWVAPEESIYTNNPWSISYPPKEMLELTRSRFFDILQKEKDNGEGRMNVVYVEREEKEGEARYVKEQGEFEEKVKEKCEQLGVDFRVHTGKESLKEQFSLFSEADLVIGPHGAGMANILFCRPGTSVRLFPMAPKVDDSFHYLSAALDLDFEEINSILSSAKGNYGTLTESQISDVLESIETVVRQRNDKGADCQN